METLIAAGPSLLLAGLALLLLPLARRDHPATRKVVMAVMAVLALRYLAWRVTATVAPLSADPASWWMGLVLGLESLSLVHLTITALILSRRRHRGPEADAGEARLRARAELPAIDVLIPSYNEPIEVLERSIIGALALDWPGGITVWVLDDGRRDWLADFCAEMGARWATRLDNAHGKAGNINAWRISGAGTAPLVMVLDADFVPQPEFLWRTVGLLDDPTIGLVQTPQSFFNPDPIQMNLLCGPALADEQRFFYHEVQPCLDAWGAAFCCGTSFVVRRACLDAIGGIPTDTVTEDMMTTFALDRHGWRTVWLDEALSSGLAAEGLAEFLGQRARWCLGTVQAMRQRSGPLAGKGVPAMSRLAFVNAQLFWLVSAPLSLVLLLAPAVFWWTGVPALLASPADFVAYFGPRYVAEAAALWWASRGAVLPVLSGVAAIVTAPVAAAAAFTGLLRPHGHRFKVTAKGGDRTSVVVHWPMLAGLGGVMAVTAIGMALDQLPEIAPLANAGNLGLNLAWSFQGLAMLFLALLVCIEVPRRRRHERLTMAEPVGLAVAGRTLAARLQDLSLSGARLAADDAPTDELVAVEIAGIAPLAARVVRRRGAILTLAFVELAQSQRRALIRKIYASPAVLRTESPDLFRACSRALRRSFLSVD